MEGIYHEYYTVALAVPMGVVVAAGAAVVWAHRRQVLAALVLAAATITTALWSAHLLRRVPEWNTWLPGAVTVVGIGAAIGLLALPKLGRRIATMVATAAAVAVLAGPASFAVSTAATPHTGSVPTAGPRMVSALFGRLQIPLFAGRRGPQQPSRRTGGRAAAAPPARRPAARNRPTTQLGGLVGTSVPSTEIRDVLLEDADQYTWIAATTGSNNAAGYQLETQRPVMPIGGFNGTDPSPTLEQFQRLVAAKQIHWYLASGLERAIPNGGSRDAALIAEWVTTHFPSVEVGGVTLYDLS
jgi:hypothetical protein